MSALGLLLLPGLAVLLIATGQPAYSILILGAVIGAIAGVVSGAVPLVALNALPSRLIGLLESDLLQALPLFVLVGALLGRLKVAELLFHLIALPFRRHHAAPVLATIGLGALLGPMNGSVGASVLSLSRAAAPSLAASRLPDAKAQAVVAVAGTLGVVMPPSLVLILLGDAMLSAHTLAINATGRTDRVMNTQDVFRAALVPALLFLLAATIVALLSRPSRPTPAVRPHDASPPPLAWSEILLGVAVIAGLVTLLGAVALGLIYAVEAAATGAVALFLAGLLSGRLTAGGLADMLSDTLTATGALFAPLLAATSFTLVLRLLGTDRLIGDGLVGLPGGETVAVVVVLVMIAASAVVLDAFEIVFVMVPVLVPPLLVRVADATWVAVLVLLTLQASYLMPPIGYALTMSRNSAPAPAPLAAVIRALSPYLFAQAIVLAAVIAMPVLVHMLDDAPVRRTVTPTTTESRQDAQSRAIDALPKRSFGTPALPKAPP